MSPFVRADALPLEVNIPARLGWGQVAAAAASAGLWLHMRIVLQDRCVQPSRALRTSGVSWDMCQRDAERLLELATANFALAEERLEQALGLLEHCDRLHLEASEAVRRQFNLAFYRGLWIDESGVRRADLNSPFAELTDRSIGLEGGETAETVPLPPAGEGDSEIKGHQRRLPSQPTLAARVERVMRERRAEAETTTKNPAISRSEGSELTLLRRPWDSNPRGACAPSGFQDRRHRPLGEPSWRCACRHLQRTLSTLPTYTELGRSWCEGVVLGPGALFRGFGTRHAGVSVPNPRNETGRWLAAGSAGVDPRDLGAGSGSLRLPAWAAW